MTSLVPQRSFVIPSIVCLVLVLMAATLPLRAQRKFDEREIKATFLFNFASFVEWPVASFADPHAPLVIGILGDDPFDVVLDAVVRGELIKNRPLAVARYRRADDITGCHILFISSSEASQYASVVEALQGRAILTVGDTDSFVASGGMIRFITDKGHVRLRINPGVVHSAGLTISSQLLRVAEVVGEGPVR